MNMKFWCLCLILIGMQAAHSSVYISKQIFRDVPFSSQYSEDGALIRSVDFRSVNDLIPQLEAKFKVLLKGRGLLDRNESHITVITPPEAKSGFFPGSVGIDRVLPTRDVIELYKTNIQNTEFDIKCVGMQSNAKGNIVFYLVVSSTDILNIRKEIFNYVRAVDSKIPFEPIKNYYPHITIGFIGGDVHGVSKGVDTCVSDVKIQ